MDLTSLSLEQKVGQLFFIGIPGPELDVPTNSILDDVGPGGICLFARNIKSREQTRELNDALREQLPVVPLISVDEEGGLVDRLRRIMTPIPAAGLMRSAQDAAMLGQIVGRSLSLLGFNMDFAPVVDVVTEERGRQSNGLYNRPFGKSADDVIAMAGAFNDEIRRYGIRSCIKHFPGYGATTVDSHEELPVVEITEDEFQTLDLEPYRQLLPQADSVMIAHATYPNVALQEHDRNGRLLPSSLSHNFVSDLLRGQLDFDGLVVTDDLEMGAVIKNYGIGDACVMAINAGCDMLAICADQQRIRDGYRAVLSAAQTGDIPLQQIDRSVQRIASLKQKISPPPAFDNGALDELCSDTTSLVERLG